MNTINSSIKKRLNIVPYTQKPNESIYLKINLEFLNSFKLSSSLIDFGLGSLAKSFQEQQQYSAQQLTSLVSDVLGSMVKSTNHSYLVSSISEIISDIAQEGLNIISTINSELQQPINSTDKETFIRNMERLLPLLIFIYTFYANTQASNLSIKQHTETIQAINNLDADVKYNNILKEHEIEVNEKILSELKNIHSSVKNDSK